MWWLVVSAVIAVLAAASFVGAIAHQNASTALVGEKDVFRSDASAAAEKIAAFGPPEGIGVRHARNALGIEAVSVVRSDGVVAESTSATLVGRPVTDPWLAAGVASGRFAALAGATDQPIEVDGVTEWAAGAVLYEVVAPLNDGRFVMLHYDVQKLLDRRVQPGDIQPLTVQLLALGAIFGLLAAAVFVGHSRAVRRHRAVVAESEMLRVHSQELEEANTKLTEARRRAERALALAEEKMRIRSDFVLMINHELRTPLTSVVTGAELVSSGELSSIEQQEMVESMVTNGRRLEEIIDQILAVARIENRGLAYHLESLPIAEVCTRIGAALEIDNPERIRIETDVSTLKLIIDSLASNAITHGATHIDVVCKATNGIDEMFEVGNQPDTAVFFTVADDGPGIDPNFLPRAFEKFEKDSFSSGTGLGLYMVRLMVEALMGSIAVHTSSHGTTFQISLPAMVRSQAMEVV